MNDDYSIIKAKKNDLEDIYSLLKSVNLPREGVESHLQNFFVIKTNNIIIGVGGVEIYEDAGLLRSIAINPKYQKKGLGWKIIEKILIYAKEEKGIKELFLLTDTVPLLYEKFGFKYLQIEQSNPKIRQSEEFNGICSQSAHLMVKNLYQF